MDIRIFENEMFGSIRSVFVESRNEFMFNGRDVCGILEYKDPYNILKRNVETVDKMKIRIQTAGGHNQQLLFLFKVYMTFVFILLCQELKIFKGGLLMKY